MPKLLRTAALVVLSVLTAASSASDFFPRPALEPRQSSNNTNASATFFYSPPHATDVNFTFSLTAVQQTGDLFYRLSVPDVYSWVAVGVGTEMEGSLIFVHYPNTNGKDIVLSPRTGAGHIEPAYDSRFKLTQVDPPSGDPHPNGIHGETWFVSGHCPKCVDSSSINFTSTTQNFIMGFGSNYFKPDSNSLSAPLRKHVEYGFFTMDMTEATVTSTNNDDISKVTAPALGTANNGAALAGGNLHASHEPSSPAHAIFMVFAFLIAYPIGVLALRVMKKVGWHMAAQSVGLVSVLIGMGVGIYISKYYLRSKHISNGHQIFGLVIVAIIVVQYTLGFVHHAHYKKTSQQLNNGLFVKIHRIVGPLVMAAGIINGAFGFRFALSRWNLVYIPLVLVTMILLLVGSAVKYFLQKKRGTRQPAGPFGAQPPPPPPYSSQPPPPAPQPPYGSQGSEQWAQPSVPYSDGGWAQRTRGDIPLTNMEPERPKEMI